MAALIYFLNCLAVVCTVTTLFHNARAANCLEPHCKEVVLVEQIEVTVNALDDGQKKLCVFCHHGQNKAWYRLWTNPKIIITSSETDTVFAVYHGQNVSEVVEKSKSSTFLTLPSFNILKKEYSFYPFNKSCIGVESSKKYKVDFLVCNPELRFVAYTCLGFAFFFFAPSWSRSIFLHYGTGISMGVLGSVLILVFVVVKFLPQRLKALGYITAAINFSAVLFLFRYITDYLHDVVLNYWQVLLAYVFVSGILSFAVVYRYGPVTDVRTLNLVRWLIQGLGLVLIYQGSQISEMSCAFIVGLLLTYNTPPGFKAYLRKIRYKLFPPRVKLLTEEEFYREGEIETRKAMEELREFCRSPECNAWRTISRLNSPSRFAMFIEGDSHVSDAEYLKHDSTAEINPLNLSDSESSGSELNFHMSCR